MPKVMERKTSSVKARQFGFYDGDDPTPGVYRAKIQKCVGVKSSGDNVMINVVAIFEAREGSNKAQYDGYAAFPRIVFGEAETLLEREQNFYLALTGKEDVKVTFAGDPTKFKAGDKQETPVTKVGNVDPVGKYVNVRMRTEEATTDPATGAVLYPARLGADAIYPLRDESKVAGSKVSGATQPVADDEPEEDDVEEYTEEGLKALALAELRRILKEEFDVDPTGIKGKTNLIGEILDAQADQDDDEDLEDDDEEDEDGDEDDVEDDEEEDEDLEAQIDDELEGMSRDEVKKALVKRAGPRRFKASETEEKLKAELKALMLEDPPF
jgi:hypothetical protein